MTSPTVPPAPAVAYPTIIGATGPNMLALSGERADGALPIMVPPAFTAQVATRPRQAPGGRACRGRGHQPGPCEGDRAAEGCRPARPAGTYAAAMVRLGYSEQEITEVSDWLVDAIVAYGDAATIGAKVRAHLAAGADHVMVMATGADFADGVNQLKQLAPTLVALTD